VYQIDNCWAKAAVLKLGVATLFRVAKYFLRVAKIFFKGRQNILLHHSTLDSSKVCSILGSRKFENILKRVAIQKSLRTPGLKDSLYSKQMVTW